MTHAWIERLAILAKIARLAAAFVATTEHVRADAVVLARCVGAWIRGVTTLTVESSLARTLEVAFRQAVARAVLAARAVDARVVMLAVDAMVATQAITLVVTADCLHAGALIATW